MLSPTKRQIVHHAPVGDEQQTEDLKPTRNELWKWCLRADAVAQCYIRDVLELKENFHVNRQDSDAFWWLGTVPCRNVKVVGMIVGAKAYERRTMYTLDDGTGVIQCVHPHAHPEKDKKRPNQKPTSKRNLGHFSSLIEEYGSPESHYGVGDILRVTGRVESWHDTRQIMVNEIDLCWGNEEPKHWMFTAQLHKSYYSQQFVIPPLPPPPFPKTPVKHGLAALAVTTPSTTITVPTPSTVASTSSLHDTTENGPIRLRHPSRLRSKELLATTFKIYLKNYMDVLSDPLRPSYHAVSSPSGECALSAPESPTKRLKRSHTDENAVTPRPRDKCLAWQEPNITPRPYQCNGRKGRTLPDPSRGLKGFTLSYLRRVPELSDMAYGIVEVERKRRSREARRKQKEAARSRGPMDSPKQPSLESTSRKVKRLYIWAIRELRKEGSIILHEDNAPVWEVPVSTHMDRDIWKASKSDQCTGSLDALNLTTPTISTFSNVLASDPGELSDPPAHEESYIPLMPMMLMEPIIDAITGIMHRKSRALRKPGTYHAGDAEAVGPTAEELQGYMGSQDARWESVGEYSIKDALELLKKEGRVYRIGNGRWELPL